ncbi:MAG: D-alanyl-D-alanine carboxypeptidase [Gammaproteobacteria bacterium]|nr:MAG: D-alanyl-D-alanine carboxypeptidase [Gammaproteobacteria bacterium]
MRFIKQGLFFVLLLIGLSSIANAMKRPVPAPPKIGAKSYILIDYHSGKVLAERSPDTKVAPASITKLMTAYVVFSELKSGNITLKEEVTISEKAWRTSGSRMFVEVNKKVAVEKLLKGMIIQSGNDASVALAEHVAGGEDTFAQYMNQYAKKLGMKDTNFMNCTGLPHKNHYTTARDISILARNLINNFPNFYDWYSQKSYTFNNITQHNRNKLLWQDKYVDGLKTGYTEDAGYCLAASAEREGMRLVSVVLGTESAKARAKQSQQLLNYGFRFFETKLLYAGNEARLSAKIWKGEKEAFKLGIKDDLFITIPRGQYKYLKASTTLDENITAPINKGEKFGVVTIKLDEDIIATRDLIALESIQDGGIWRSMVDSVKMWLE